MITSPAQYTDRTARAAKEFEMLLFPFFWFMLPFMVLCPVLPPRSRDV